MLAERIQFVTGNFSQLKGLRLVPFGLFFLARAASSRGWFDWLPGRPVERPGDFGTLWSVLFFVLVIVFAWAAEDRYRERYGTVIQHPRTKRNAFIALAIAVVVFTGLLDGLLELPVRLSALAIAGSLFAVVQLDGHFRRHYMIAAAAWLVVSAMPLMGFTFQDTQFAGGLCAGLSLIVCGVGDHLLLTRTFVPQGKRLDVTESVTV